MGGLNLSPGQTYWKICLFQKEVEDFWDEHFSSVTVEGMDVDFNMDGFSGSLFTFLVSYLELWDVGLWVVVGNAVYVNCTGYMTNMFFYSISKHLLDFQTSAGFSYLRMVSIFFWAEPFMEYVFLAVMEF